MLKYIYLKNKLEDQKILSTQTEKEIAITCEKQ